MVEGAVPLAELKGLLNDWALGMQAGGGWNALFWNNHDQPRALNRFGDVQRYRAESATMLATVIHLLRGTPYIYQGEEIGMIDPVYSSIDDYVDVEAHNAFKTLHARGLSEGEALEVVRAKARDNSRVPMQWESGSGGERGAVGFGTAAPWLAHAPSVDAATGAGISVTDEERDGVILPYYRELIRLRGQYPVISEGSYAPYALDHERVFGYLREHIAKGTRTRLLVLNNFFGDETAVRVPAEFMPGEVMDALAGCEGSRVPADARSARVLLCNYKNPLGQVSGVPAPIPARLRLRPASLRVAGFDRGRAHRFFLARQINCSVTHARLHGHLHVCLHARAGGFWSEQVCFPTCSTKKDLLAVENAVKVGA